MMKDITRRKIIVERVNELLDKGNELQRNKQYEESILLYEQAYTLFPKNEVPYNNIAVSYYRLKDYKKCEYYLKKSYELNPNNKLTIINLASCLNFQEKYKSAVKYYKLGIDGYMNDRNVVIPFCKALYNLGKYKEASKYLSNAVSLNADDTDIHIMLIDALIQSENFKDAESVLGKLSLTDKNAEKAQMQASLIQKAIEYNKNIKIKNRKTVNSLCDFISVINEIKHNSNDFFIYRGQRNKYNPLIPSLYRDKKLKDDEMNIIQDFNLKAEAFFNREMELFDSVDKVALMQHHGIPTRLLDFSESPLIALYFALEKYSPDIYNIAPCVYIINIKAFTHNKKGHLLSSKQVMSKNEDKIFKYTKGSCAFSPKLKNRRITAQKGVFVLCNDETPLELSISEDCLIKIEIPRDRIENIQQELNNIGITPSTIYPDFMGLAEEIKKPHKFVNQREENERYIVSL